MSGPAPSPGNHGRSGAGETRRAGTPSSWLPAVLALALTLLASWWWSRDESAVADNAPQPPVAVAPAQHAPGVTVHVSGLVARPGLVEVPAGGRVADAVAGAGGLLPDADLALLNLAAPVRDGERIVVGDTAAAAAMVAHDDGKVRVNAADGAALEALPGVGPVLAQRIVDFRTEHGPFATVEDLLDVPGIGEGKLAAMRDVVIVP